ncbi:cellulose synthase [Penicillium brasilianum]|uniref:Cellulose synthase n=1 Tax=Penicillium brasilianum TaxID=104259 RepID=A0A1S9RFV9_PENBI|nr:cellulose synthase [Penicillium brasilianum]
MAADQIYDIRELPEDPQIRSGRRYRNSLSYVAQSAIWIGNIYVALRLLAILLSPQTWQVWVMFLVEAVFVHLSRKDQHLVIAASKVKESGPRKKLRVHGAKGLPHVDVLLPCCGEDVDVIMATVRAACALDYPTSCFRVRVLDDGGSAALKAAVSALQSQWSHVSYHSRGRQSGMVFAKSGNLNYALTTLQNETPPEFCAILDADSVPCPHFLRATLPHLLQCPDAALVSTRQYFSNLPNGDPLSQTRSHFYTCQNAALDVLGLAIDAGSGAVFRRSAIVQVGLYPTFSFSEDWQLSQILHGNGWRTFQVQEPLQFGLVPDSLTGHCAQRNRWNIGHAQQIPAMLSSDYKHYTKSLRWSVIWDGFGIVAGEVECFFGFLAIPLLLLSGQLIPTTYPALVKAQIFMAICQVSVMWIYEYVQAALNNFQSAPFAHLENKWLAGPNILAILRFYLVSAKPKGSSFVTGSVLNSWNQHALSACRRMYLDLWKNGVFYNLSLLLATVWAAYLAITSLMAGQECTITSLLTSVAFPPLLHICYLTLTVNWVPVAYILNPPHYPNRSSQSKTENGKPASNVETKREATSESRWPAVGKVGKEILHLGTRLEIQERPEL